MPSFPLIGMMHSPGFDGGSSLSFQMLMNADSLYTAALCALLLNLKLSHGDYYRKRPAVAPGMMVSMSSGMGFPLDKRWCQCLCAAECQASREKLLASVFCAPLLCSTRARAGLEGGEDECEVHTVITCVFSAFCKMCSKDLLTLLWLTPLA